MKQEDKVITIFNKNGINITKKYKRENFKPEVIYVSKTIDNTVVNTSYESLLPSHKKSMSIKCESPLGFYYYKKYDRYNNPPKTKIEIEDLSKTIVNISIIGIEPNYTYTISYLTSYHGTKVDKETRPWDLIGGTFPDNYVFGLLDDINHLFDLVSKVKNVEIYQDLNNGHYWEKDNRNYMQIGEMKRKIINDLFGDPDGPKFQTNNEKILAHGFDLKTSFRKM